MTMWGSPQQIHTHAIYWQQHFMENLGYGNSIAGPDDSLGINLGFAVLIGTCLSVIAVFRPGLTSYQRRRVASLLLVFGVLALSHVSADVVVRGSGTFSIHPVSLAPPCLHRVFWRRHYCDGVACFRPMDSSRHPGRNSHPILNSDLAADLDAICD